MIENQRIRLTKQLLRESLIDLLSEKSIHKVSVREVCDRAQINRTTFYKYFGSPYDLLIDIEDTVLAQVEDYLSGQENVIVDDVRRLTQIVTYMEENLALCRLLINNTVDSRFAERLLMLPKIQRLLVDQLSGGYQNDAVDYMYQFVVNGGFYMIKNWINKETREEPEKIAALLLNAVVKILD
jgi:AcrR family transcriptional regulator